MKQVAFLVVNHRLLDTAVAERILDKLSSNIISAFTEADIPIFVSYLNRETIKVAVPQTPYQTYYRLMLNSDEHDFVQNLMEDIWEVNALPELKRAMSEHFSSYCSLHIVEGRCLSYSSFESEQLKKRSVAGNPL